MIFSWRSLSRTSSCKKKACHAVTVSDKLFVLGYGFYAVTCKAQEQKESKLRLGGVSFLCWFGLEIDRTVLSRDLLVYANSSQGQTIGANLHSVDQFWDCVSVEKVGTDDANPEMYTKTLLRSFWLCYGMLNKIFHGGFVAKWISC